MKRQTILAASIFFCINCGIVDQPREDIRKTCREIAREITRSYPNDTYDQYSELKSCVSYGWARNPNEMNWTNSCLSHYGYEIQDGTEMSDVPSVITKWVFKLALKECVPQIYDYIISENLLINETLD